LLVGNFLGTYQFGGVAGARCGNRRIEWVREGITQRDTWKSGFYQRFGSRTFEHARLISHDGTLFYTHCESDTPRRQVTA
jgi:hypothetical protein